MVSGTQLLWALNHSTYDVKACSGWGRVRAAERAVEGAEHLDYNDASKYMGLPKDRRIVFLCKDGDRALSVASYFIGHQFTNVLSVRGGLDAWRAEVDPSVPTY